MSIRADGVVSGINTSGIVSELSAIYGRPKKILEARINIVEQRRTAFSELNTMMSSLKDSLTAIQDVTDFRSFTASQSEASESFFTVTADGSATAGTYSIGVQATAKSEMHVISGTNNTSGGTAGFTSATSTVANGTLRITWDSQTKAEDAGFAEDSTGLGYFEITVGTDTNLSELASTLDAKAGISSYVLNDGDEFYLVLQSEKTGEDYGFTIGYLETSTTLSGTGTTQERYLNMMVSDVSTTNDTSANLDSRSSSTNATTAGTDAVIYANGIEVSNDTNTFSDTINGLTITAIAVSDEDGDGLSATPDSGDTYDATVTLDVSSISDKVDDFVASYNKIITYINNRTVFDTEANTRGIFNGDANTRTIVRRLQQIIGDRYSDLQTANGVDLTLNSLSVMGVTLSSSDDGTLTFSSSDFADALEDHQFDVEAMFSDDSDGVSETLITTLDDYIKSYTGVFAKIDDTLSGQIDSLEKQVDRWKDRIASYEARLFKQFTAMEKIAGSMQTSGQFLTSFFSKKS